MSKTKKVTTTKNKRKQTIMFHTTLFVRTYTDLLDHIYLTEDERRENCSIFINGGVDSKTKRNERQTNKQTKRYSYTLSIPRFSRV